MSHIHADRSSANAAPHGRPNNARPATVRPSLPMQRPVTDWAPFAELHNDAAERANVETGPVARVPLGVQRMADSGNQGAPPDANIAGVPGYIVERALAANDAMHMGREQFLAAVRFAVHQTATKALAGTGFSADECPWIPYWIGYYRMRTPEHIERSLLHFAPEAAAARSAAEYIPYITARVARGIATWACTGTVTEVPEEVVAGGQPAEPASSGDGKEVIQRMAAGDTSAATANPTAIQRSLGTGRPLDGAVRGRMEQAMGTDLGHMRLHTDAGAAGLAGRLNAKAFTVGDHVAFARGEYNPGTVFGDGLIAHEAAHTVQQRGGGSAGPANYSGLEADAERSTAGVLMRMWGGVKGAAGALRERVGPAMRSGLSLQRCGEEAHVVPPIPTSFQRLGVPNEISEGPAIGQSKLRSAEQRTQNYDMIPKGRPIELPGEITVSPGTILAIRGSEQAGGNESEGNGDAVLTIDGKDYKYYTVGADGRAPKLKGLTYSDVDAERKLGLVVTQGNEEVVYQFSVYDSGMLAVDVYDVGKQEGWDIVEGPEENRNAYDTRIMDAVKRHFTELDGHGVVEVSMIVKRIMARESVFDPEAGSSKGATGLLQIVPSTAGEEIVKLLNKGAGSVAQKVSSEDISWNNVEQNIDLGVLYLHHMFKRLHDAMHKNGWKISFDDQLKFTVAGYNAYIGKYILLIKTWMDYYGIREALENAPKNENGVPYMDTVDRHLSSIVITFENVIAPYYGSGLDGYGYLDQSVPYARAVTDFSDVDTFRARDPRSRIGDKHYERNHKEK